ncbi:helix-turn-helix domain-containing protein [Bacillus piscicola]|uniref:helix-turn-helix domain-containing protein n=1 Tax=Bacillus piscicola TaxID=1632684 RepID=UPI001F08F90A|nr:helix-turn-helix domain-containing protein [Bacillus piscicola]
MIASFTFRHYIFLLVLRSLEGDRTPSSLFHILTGKKTSQTIQDIKWYRLTEYFRMFPYWDKETFQKDIDMLERAGMYREEEERAYLTLKGKKEIERYFHDYKWPRLYNGWKYSHAAGRFWERLALFIQSLSFSLAKRSFLPVFRDFDTQQWVKQHWPRQLSKKKTIAQKLHEELVMLLRELPEQDALLFTCRLSGHNHSGYTLQQAAQHVEQHDMDELYYRFHAVLHYLLEAGSDLPFLGTFCTDLLSQKILTDSARKTQEYLAQGMSLSDIATIRDLKQSTIEDHVVEIASEEAHFPISLYVPEKVQQAIIRAAQNSTTYRLKVLKEKLEDKSVDYFSIRLTLAYFGGTDGQA